MSIITVSREDANTGFTRRDWLLIALTFAAGAIDAISYFGLGKIFSAFMTGNLVFLGFGIGHVGGPDPFAALCAVVLFSLGAYLGTRLTLSPVASTGWPRIVLGTLAVVALLEAVFFAIWVAYAGDLTPAVVNGLIALLSFAMGLQMAGVRALGVAGVFTTAATFTLLAFFGDFAGSRPLAEAPRLGGTLLALVLGAFAGGLLFTHAPLYAPALPLAVTILVIIAGMLMARTSADAGPSAAR